MVTCNRYELAGASYQTPGLKIALQKPFILTMPADSPLNRLFEHESFNKTTIELPERPEIPLSIFSDQLLEDLVSIQEKKSESGLDLDELELDELTVTALKNGGVESVEALKLLTDDDLLKINGIGGGRLGKIREALVKLAVDEADADGDADEDDDPDGSDSGGDNA